MILLVHNGSKVLKIEDIENQMALDMPSEDPSKCLFLLAKNHTLSLIIWCHETYVDYLNVTYIKVAFNTKNVMHSYGSAQYMPHQIGYVEDSPFLKVNKKVKYPTWLMSSNVGAIYASTALKLQGVTYSNESFDYNLNTMAKRGMANGLFCYSDPSLLKGNEVQLTSSKASVFRLFKFVKQQYKARWVIMLLANFIVHEKRWPVLSMLTSLFYKRAINNESFKAERPIEDVIKSNATVDVVIPTIGRASYLKDVLYDLSQQLVLPKQVIIVEQNPDTSSTTELPYINDDQWPFKIVHEFTHKTGACNARNRALSKVSSDYIFLADDDIRFGKDLLKNTIQMMAQFNIGAATLSCLGPDTVSPFSIIHQWPSFGSGCSMIKAESAKGILFNMALEFGYGEDVDFGMQLRNRGVDVIYFPDPKISHLSAPIGGFRTKFVHPWEGESILPKPAPTVMLNRMANSTKYQLFGYKTTLFLKFYKEQQTKNPFRYYKMFKAQWKQSVYWANKLREDHSQ